jgi:hypothetical protein
MGCSDVQQRDDDGWRANLAVRSTAWDDFLKSHTIVQADGSNLYVIAEDLRTSSVDDLRRYYDSLDEVDKSVGSLSGGNFIKWPKHEITYCVGSTSNWESSSTKRDYIRALMVEAARIWVQRANIRWRENNSLGSSCQSSEPSAGNVDFAVVSGGTSSDFGGTAFFPNWSASGRKFIVNLGIFTLSGYSTWSSSGTLLTGVANSDVPFFSHEVGHTMGLDHEHGHTGTWDPDPAVSDPDTSRCWDLSADPEDLTSEIDYCSVMTTYGCEMNATWQAANCPRHFETVISSFDGFGVARLYGPPAWVTVL